MNLLATTDARTENGWKHGLYARRVLVRAEESGDFVTLRDALVEEWRPRTVTAWLLVDQLARLHWRLLRAGEAEAEKLDRLQTQPGVGGGGAIASPEAALAFDVGRAGSALQRIQLYQMRLERAAHRCVALLIALRKSRGKRGNPRRDAAREKSA